MIFMHTCRSEINLIDLSSYLVANDLYSCRYRRNPVCSYLLNFYRTLAQVFTDVSYQTCLSFKRQSFFRFRIILLVIAARMIKYMLKIVLFAVLCNCALAGLVQVSQCKFEIWKQPISALYYNFN